MVESCVDFCVLKAYDLTLEEAATIRELGREAYIAVYVSDKFMDYSITIINEDQSELIFNQLLSDIYDVAKDKIYSDCGANLEEEVIRRARAKNVKIALAESITGGLVSSTLVNVPGASYVLHEGFVTYSSISKVRRLHVKSTTLDKFGAVSKEICTEMVQGLMSNKEVQISVATTGCAGPDSDEFETPIGRVYVGIGGALGIKVETFNLRGDREDIRKTVNNIALHMMLDYIEKL